MNAPNKIKNQMLRDVLSEKQNIKLNDFGFSLKIKEQLLNSVSNKLNPNNSEEIKYHKKCIMLTGLPNTGKTTLGMSILNEFQCETFIIKTQTLIKYSLEFDNNSRKHYSPEILKELFEIANSYKNSIIFFDDFELLFYFQEYSELQDIFFENIKQVTFKPVVFVASNEPSKFYNSELFEPFVIPLPDEKVRYEIIQKILENEPNSLSEDDVNYLANITERFTPKELDDLIREASYEPLRSIFTSEYFRKEGDVYIPCNCDEEGSIKKLELTNDQLELLKKPDLLNKAHLMEILKKTKSMINETDIKNFQENNIDFYI